MFDRYVPVLQYISAREFFRVVRKFQILTRLKMALFSESLCLDFFSRDYGRSFYIFFHSIEEICSDTTWEHRRGFYRKMFRHDLIQTWRNVTTNQSDFKELVPEFYQSGDFLTNSLGIDFGKRQAGD